MDPHDESITMLESMFPGVSRERLRAVLEATNFNVERAVELLLQNPTDQPQPVETTPTELVPIESAPVEDPAYEFETLEERRDMLLALQLQRDEELAVERHKTKKQRRLEQAAQQEQRAAESGEESDESEGEAKRQDEEDLINFGEIADKLNEFGEAAKQKFKIFADKISNLFEGDHPPQPPAPTGASVAVVPQPTAIVPEPNDELNKDDHGDDDVVDAELVDRRLRVASRQQTTEEAVPVPVGNLLGFEPKNES